MREGGEGVVEPEARGCAVDTNQAKQAKQANQANSYMDDFSHHEQPVDPANVIAFYSGAKAPFCGLSNFAACENGVEFEGKIYPTSEHAFQAGLSKTAHLFESSGPFSKLTEEAFVQLGVKPAGAPKKVKFWSGKKMVGILAKMKINRQKKQGATKRVTKQEAIAAFRTILKSKYTRNPHLRSTLLSTKGTRLLEFVRSAERNYKNGEVERWGGMVVDRKIIGHNQMGAIMESVRDELLMESEGPF
jgi:predicted NAD-dependent protein-ADP-ribosyltransferase YbiA (DUF1768 family)